MFNFHAYHIDPIRWALYGASRVAVGRRCVSTPKQVQVAQRQVNSDSPGLGYAINADAPDEKDPASCCIGGHKELTSATVV
jgi:hypothetical protein